MVEDVPRFLFHLIALVALCSLSSAAVGRFLFSLGAPQPKPFASSGRAWVGLSCTAVLAVLWFFLEIGAAVSSRTDEGLGAGGFPLYWAAVFAPWMLLRYWGPEPILELSKSRLCMLLLVGAGVLGWLGRSYVA